MPRREMMLHLAVRMGDAQAAEMLMSTGKDWSLQNEQGWSALQEAVCAREEGIAMIIMKHYQPLAWAKWCRRVPRVMAAMKRMRDFYMEITFHFLELCDTLHWPHCTFGYIQYMEKRVQFEGRYDPCGV